MTLNKTKLDFFKNLLTIELNKIETELKRLNKYPDLGNSSEDNAEELEEFGSNVNLRTKLTKIKNEVNFAINKFNQNSYGYCESCKKSINLDRLKAYPAANFCIDCENKKSRRWWQLFRLRNR